MGKTSSILRVTGLAGVLLAAGCSVSPSHPVPVEDRGVPPATDGAAGLPRRDSIPGERRGPAAVETIEVETRRASPEATSPRVPDSATPAVVALLETARQAEDRGNLELSEANLERAIRIESRNPMIWHRLALIKLFRKQYAEAVAMAERSNALAVGRRQLQRDNWRLIAQAEEARGRSREAERAAARARGLEP